MRPIVFIAGPLRSDNPAQVVANVLTAQRAATDLAKLGCAAYCPHSNIGFALGEMSERHANGVNDAFLHLAAALYALPGSKYSRGARREIRISAERGIPILVSVQEVRAWRARLR